jgi:hypothetical protein
MPALVLPVRFNFRPEYRTRLSELDGPDQIPGSTF